MNDGIVSILRSLRRRLLAVRAAEASAAGGIVGGLLAVCLMAAWIVAGPHPLWAAGLCAVPAAVGAWILLSRRSVLHLSGALRWYAGAAGVLGGAAGGAAVLTGFFAFVPKNSLALFLPALALAAGAAALLRGAPLGRVAAWVDRRAGLRERLSTAYELGVRGGSGPFAGAVRRQALSAGQSEPVRRLRFWTRTRATAGALGLAVIGALLLLPWEPLATPQAIQQQRYEQAAPAAAEDLERRLANLDLAALAADPSVGKQLQRVRELAELLRSARPADAGEWRGQVVELGKVADALRQAVREGKLDAATSRQVQELVRALDEAAAHIAAAMGGREPARQYSPPVLAGGSTTGPSANPPAAPTQYVSVYDPRYATLATTGTSSGPSAGPGLVPYDKAWADARRRAADALDRDAVPAQYRSLVRDFFAEK